ncbi:MAG: DUF3109 family protein [Bacteroidetes bacterium]|nr:MAG: DUF3109 family protein [Bacteroidota bacterium]
MIEVDNTIVSRDLFEEEFVCNLSKCKGICCIEGDAGAPLSKSEVSFLKKNITKIKPFLRKEGIREIENQGVFVTDTTDNEPVTPLVKNAECAYVVFEKDGTASCGIEKAYEAGVIDFKKPISCHLYPIRITAYRNFDAVNYHRWEICSDACVLGKELKIKVYQFLKEPLIRKYGAAWYEKLQLIDQEYFSKKNNELS